MALVIDRFDFFRLAFAIFCLAVFFSSNDIVGVSWISSTFSPLDVVDSGVMGHVMLISISVLLMLDRLLSILERLLLKLDSMVVFTVRSSLSSSSRPCVWRIACFIESVSILTITADGVKGGRGVAGPGDTIGNGDRASLDLLFLGVVLGVAGFFLNENLFLADSSTTTESESSPPPPKK